MPPPIGIELVPHDPAWVSAAAAEGRRLASALGPALVAVHHVGSTAVAGLVAKPILDLMPVLADAVALDGCEAGVRALGYEWWGELGLPGRRYCTLGDPGTGRRLVQLHCYAAGSPDIDRHLAFRDYLRRRPDRAAAYGREKERCQRLHPQDSHTYGTCKGGWVDEMQAEALQWWHTAGRSADAEPGAAADPPKAAGR